MLRLFMAVAKERLYVQKILPGYVRGFSEKKERRSNRQVREINAANMREAVTAGQPRTFIQPAVFTLRIKDVI